MRSLSLMKYRSAISDELKTDIAYYWRLSGFVDKPVTETLFGDTRADIIFDLNGNIFGTQSARIAGPYNRPDPLNYHGHIDLLGIRFTPWGFTTWSGTPTSLITNQSVSLQDYLPSLSPRIDAVFEANDKCKTETLNQFLNQQHANHNSAEISKLVGLLIQAGYHTRASTVKSWMDQSPRQSERQFKHTVGISIKTFLRLNRCREMIRGLKNNRQIQELVFHCGFSDQSHAIRELKYFTGKTPSQFNLIKFPIMACFMG